MFCSEVCGQPWRQDKRKGLVKTYTGGLVQGTVTREDDLGVGLILGEGAEAVPGDTLVWAFYLGRAQRQSLEKTSV